MRFASRGLRRHLMAGVYHGVFPPRKRLLLAPLRQHRWRDLRLKRFPSAMKRGLRFVEGVCVAGSLLMRRAARIKSA